MVDLLLVWWPVLLVLQLPMLANWVAAQVAARVQSALDHRIPDRMPMTAGDWLASRIAGRGLPISAIVHRGGGDAYLPRFRLIQLQRETYFKSDPVYWAAAAHELGHARLRCEHPWIDAVQQLARLVAGALGALGVALAIATVLYGVPAGTSDAAFACFAVAVALRVPVLVEEIAASVLGLRELRASQGAPAGPPGVGPEDLRAARRVLVAAFATYLAQHASTALLLTQWAWFEQLAGAGLVPGTATPLGALVAVIAALGALVYAGLGVAMFVAPGLALRSSRWRDALGIAGAISLIGFVVLVWDRDASTAYIACVVAALAASHRIWIGLLHLPGVPLALLLGRLERLVRGRGIQVTPQFLRALAGGAPRLAEGGRVLRELERQVRRDPPRLPRYLARVGVIALVIAFFAMLAG